MVTIAEPLDFKESPLKKSDKDAKHHRIIKKTLINNKDSDYTEKLRDLGNEFKYSDNAAHYWCDPELSLLYGTPLYDDCSEAQKLALNHLYWVGNYNHTAVSEATTSIYNMVTNGVFRSVGGYDELCDELDFETDQESYHIRTFQKVGFKTKTALVGRTTLCNSLSSNFRKGGEKGRLQSLVPQPVWEYFVSDRGSSPFSLHRDKALVSVAKLMLRGKKQYYSDYLKNLQDKGEQIPAPSDGLGGRIADRYWLKFFTVNWGMSPFMACQYYSLRYTANAILKNQEFPYVRYYRELERKGEFIPTPTAISNFHLLDEAFHTTISQTLAKDVYRDFPKPTAYEKFVSGFIIYKMQHSLLGGLSGILPGRCVYDDSLLLTFYYKLLRSPLFEMSSTDALHWLERCVCENHDGYKVGLKYHQSLLELMQRLFGSLDYQWKVNREMGVMAAGGSIEKALEKNRVAFKQFAQLVESHEN
ncbi:MAG: hypothetical protein KTR27_20985 [Leptolyngbyaceae cyanobacterium MAG.088]|nr:hypothetical protein [Leptolyngbyaceae cyanobacterium MAG.088]